MIVFSFWIPQEQLSLDRETAAVVREADRLLQEQERLLELPMSPADMMLYEIRSEQIGELVAQLTAQVPARLG